MAGRPSLYKTEYAEQARKLCLLGATDPELADFFGVARSTFNEWKLKHPELVDALKSGKEVADERVERSLYHKAIGYTFEATHFSSYQGTVTATPYQEHVPPSDTACIFWLKNRRPDLWRDVWKHEHTGKDGGSIKTEDVSARDRLFDLVSRVSKRERDSQDKGKPN